VTSTLVTGAAGLIGGALVRRLLAAGHQVIATDARVDGMAAAGRIERADLTDRPALVALLRDNAVHTVIHCGAISGPMVAKDDPHYVFAVNVGGTLNLAEAARKSEVSRFIALSSASVYGVQSTLEPVTENAPTNATDVYGASKIAMEAVLRAYRSELGLPAVALRIASVYGPGRQTDCLIRELIQSAASDTPIRLCTEGGFRRQFIHVDDVVRAIMQAVGTNDIDDFVYNIVGGTWLTEQEVADLAATILPRLSISKTPAPTRCIDGYMGPLDGTRAAVTFGYKPQVDIRDGIASYAAHLDANARSPPNWSGKLFASS
jgi:nucleoside-diphosphate-sugar epimerase